MLGRIEKKRFLRLILIISIVILLVLTFDSFRRLLVLIFFVVLNFGFALLKRQIPTSFLRKYFYGIEFVLFCTVLTGVGFGAITGAIMGALLMVSNYIAERRVSEYLFSTTALYIIVGFTSFYLKELSMMHLGILMALGYNALAFIISKIQGANTFTLIVFNAINIGFNILLFSAFGELVRLLIL